MLSAAGRRGKPALCERRSPPTRRAKLAQFHQYSRCGQRSGPRFTGNLTSPDGPSSRKRRLAAGNGAALPPSYRPLPSGRLFMKDLQGGRGCLLGQVVVRGHVDELEACARPMESIVWVRRVSHGDLPVAAAGLEHALA
jgi:hypothetical protein